MAKANPIQPFPLDLDRNAFGHWLSGFTDGEGCFSLTTSPRQRRVVTPLFRITLRGDDDAVLNLIHAYLGCGAVRRRHPPQQTHPVCSFEVWNTAELAGIVVSHFERFPLRAKKSRDFAIWREAVLFMASGLNRTVQHVKGLWGCQPKWSEAEKQHLRGLAARLKAQREFSLGVL